MECPGCGVIGLLPGGRGPGVPDRLHGEDRARDLLGAGRYAGLPAVTPKINAPVASYVVSLIFYCW